MNKLFLLVVFVTSMAKAQSFDFSCEQLLTGQITMTGIPAPLGIYTVEDPRGDQLPRVNIGRSFNLTIAGEYLLTIAPFGNTATRTINITENGNQSLLWSEL